MQDVERTYYPSGELKSEVFVVNGKRNGEYKLYRETGCDYNNMSSIDSFGKLHIICTYVDGKRNGEYKEYFKKRVALYEDEKCNSQTDSFGQLYIICTYIDGKLNGEEKIFHRNGQLYRICSYIDGKKNGLEKEYFCSGKIFKIRSYNNFNYFGYDVFISS
jgi:antitoxin component YwqK of YwqJK toxin-antitoxin module